jgi:hypothetical protein
MRRTTPSIVRPGRLRTFAALILAGVCNAAGWAQAPPLPAGAACALDNAPAATLLLPHFQVDFGSTAVTTLFSVGNSAPTAVLTRVTLWTELGIPTLSFHVYLTGYDLETVNLRDVFEGRLPATASAGQDASGTVSPKGPYSQDLDFANCAGFLPPAALSPQAVQDLRAEHRGLASTRLGGKCAAFFRGDDRIRGYLTIDTVGNCAARTPKDPAYFAADATAQNVLFGDYFFVEPGDNFASGDSLVRVQAFPGRFTTGQRTFYSWLHAGSVADQREPLGLSWSARFLDGGAFSGGTEILYWHDAATPYEPYVCGQIPLPQPQTTVDLTLFDEQENAEIPACFPIPAPCYRPIFFPFIANRVTVDGPELPVPWDAGSIQVYPANPTFFAPQSWMGVVMKASGRYSVGFAATPLDSACGTAACPPGQDCTP